VVAERYLKGVDAFEHAATWFLLMHHILRLLLGDRWRYNRKTAEAMKREGWLFVSGSGPYADLATRISERRFHETRGTDRATTRRWIP
jgi:hypothetical protein